MSNIPLSQLNFQKHIIATSSSDVRHIAKPLEKHGIVHFSYTKTYENRSTIVLTTHPEVSEKFIEDKFYLKVFCESIDKYISCNAFWEDLGCPELLQLTIEGFGLYNGLVMVKKTKNVCEFFHFATQRNANFSNYFYLNNIDALEQFILYFKIIAKPLLNLASQQRILYPQPSDESVLVSSTWKEKILSSAKILADFSPNIGHSKSVQLTKRELECTSYLKKGFSIKEIAQQMEISPRTAEKHIKHIKSKLNCATKSKVIAKLLT